MTDSDTRTQIDHTHDILTANLPHPGQAKPDPRLQQAVNEACRMHQVTPILKEELRAAIMLRRLSSGQGEITHEETHSRVYELTADEVAKQERRRAQNRVAAQRCRKKKRQEQEKFLQLFSEQNNKRQRLEEEVSELREEKRRLEAMLVHHMLTRACHKGHVTPPQNVRCASFSPGISSHSSEDESFYDFFQDDSKKFLPVETSVNLLSNDLESELPGEDASMIYNLDNRHFLADLSND
ncbi:cyclic AMP-dependent transcription factor ATF-3-like [Haliotis asinina]|uniref:cyclic AMP-dependent transcription factor ATF-3-like n=1 Tax=Haliotis asinina TaxID=109174 RepID=UPI003531BCCD